MCVLQNQHYNFHHCLVDFHTIDYRMDKCYNIAMQSQCTNVFNGFKDRDMINERKRFYKKDDYIPKLKTCMYLTYYCVTIFITTINVNRKDKYIHRSVEL